MFLKMQVAIIIWYLAVIYILNLEGNASLLSITFLAQQPLNSVLWVWVVMAIFFFPLKRGEEKKMEMIKIKRGKKKKTHNLSLGKKRVKSIKHSNHCNLSVSFMLLFHIYFEVIITVE